MKLFHLLAAATVIAFSANVIAQPAPQAAHTKGVKITKITGTVNIMKDGVVIMTLKPGDAIPEITDNKVTFAIVDGTVEVEAGGKKISGATGSNFTVTSNEGQVNVSLGAGTPVAVKSESGHNVILTANSEVKMINANGMVQITMEKGNGVMTNSSGGETQTVQAGQAVAISAMPMIVPPPAAPVAPPAAPVVPVTPEATPVTPDAPFIMPEVVAPPPPSVNPIVEIVQEICAVSASSPCFR